MGLIGCSRQQGAVPDAASIAQAARLIAGADALFIAAGAGMGVDSGIPDFGGNAGFWRAYPALAREGVAFMDIASPEAFDADPHRAWGFYGHRLAMYRQARPHAGFDLLRRWGEGLRHGYFVVTSHVDGHFEKGGMDPLRIDECHGSMHYLQCARPCSSRIWSAAEWVPVVDTARCRLLSPLPTCPHCGGPARPNVLMFDDGGWIGVRQQRQAMRRLEWLEGVRRPVVIEIGAGINIATVRHLSEQAVLRHQAALIRINPRAAQIGKLPGVAIAGGALQSLVAIDAILMGRSLAA